MLKRSSEVSASTIIPSQQLLRPVDLIGLARLVWRHKRPMIFLGACGGMLGLAYCLVATPSYTSTASILLEPRAALSLDDQKSLASEQIEAPYVDSQVEVLKSGRVLGRVVALHNLVADKEFSDAGGSIIGKLIGLFRWQVSPDSAADLERVRAIEGLRRHIEVKRVGLTYVLSVAVTSQAPQKSADLANAVSESFLADNLDARSNAAKAAAGWLQENVGALRSLAVAADARAQEFRAKNNIVTAGNGLITDQQVSEISTQLTAARTQLSDAQAKYEKLGPALAAGENNGAALQAELPPESIVKKLQERVIQNNLRIEQLVKANGETHNSVQKLKEENLSLEKSISEELQRIGTNYKNDMEIAKQRVNALEATLQGAVGTSNLASSAQVKLRDLEREADSYKAVYEASLSKLQETAQQENFPVSEYRIISAATPVFQKSHPRSMLTIALATLAGIAAGSLISVYRATRDGTMRSMNDVAEALDGRCLCSMPKVHSPTGLMAAVCGEAPELTAPARAAKLMLRDWPTSNQCAVVGIISTRRGEGRSTFAASLAASHSASGLRTLLVDADFGNPGLTNVMAASSSHGLRTALSNESQPGILAFPDGVSAIHFLPAGTSTPRGERSDPLASANLFQTMNALRDSYDVIILDVAPLAESMDALAVSPFVDAFVYLVEWGRTQAADVLEALSETGDLGLSVAGYVLTRAPPSRRSLWAALDKTQWSLRKPAFSAHKGG